MKKLMMAAALAVASLSANAQVYLGGGVGFDSYHNGDADKSYTAFKIMPEIGYKLDDQISFGISFGYSSAEHNSARLNLSKGAKKTTTLSINPYLRYTFARWNNVSFFGEVGFGYENETESHTTGSDTKVNSWYLGVQPGIAVDLTKNFTFLTKIGWLGYESSKPDYDNAKADSNFGLNVSSENIKFSLLYNF